MSKLFIATGVVSLLLLVALSIDVGRHYYNDENEHLLVNIDQMQRLELFGKTAIGRYPDSLAASHKKGDSYIYMVDRKQYNGTVKFDNAPQKPSFNITYLPENPVTHAIDPTIQLATSRKQLMENEKVPPVSWILLLLSFGGLIFSAIRLKKR